MASKATHARRELSGARWITRPPQIQRVSSCKTARSPYHAAQRLCFERLQGRAELQVSCLQSPRSELSMYGTAGNLHCGFSASQRSLSAGPRGLSDRFGGGGEQGRRCPVAPFTAKAAAGSVQGPVDDEQATIAGEPSTIAKLVRRAQVYWIAARLFVDIKLTQRTDKAIRKRLGLTEDDEHPEIEALWEPTHERCATRLYSGIVRLAGFWVKVGQYLSSRADVMPPAYLRVLASLQDDVPAKPFQEVQQTLREEFSDHQMSQLISVDPTPLSTASLAQVHRGTLRDGREVVVKAQHRGVGALMRQDMGNLRAILELVALFDKDADFGPVVKEWTKEVLKELDFRTEAANMEQVRMLLEECSVHAIVPRSIEHLVTERILVMDYCQGFAIKDTAQLDANKVDREVLVQRVCQAWAAQMHVAGVFNADPHAGNILVSTARSSDQSDEAHDPSVPVLLDFGLTKRLEPAMKVAFARLMHSSEEMDVDGLLKSFDEMGLKLNRYDPFEDMRAMRSSFSDTVPKSEAKEARKKRNAENKQRQDARQEEEQVQKGGKLRNPVDAWPAELVFFTRVTAMLRGLCSSLEVRHPYMSTMAAYSRVALREEVPANEHAVGVVYPRGEGMSHALQARLEAVAAELVTRGDTVGMQVCVRSHGSVIASVAAGTLGTADPRPVTPSTLFNVFSVSKAVLAMGVHVLISRGDIRLDDPIAKHWAEFGAAGKEKVTVRDALSHQAGLANAMPKAATLDTLVDWTSMTQFVASAEAEHAPGEETKYHYLTFAWICGGLIEAVTGAPYEQLLESEIIEPLALQDELYMGGVPAHVEAASLAVLTMDRRKAQENGKESADQQQRGANGDRREARVEEHKAEHQSGERGEEQKVPATRPEGSNPEESTKEQSRAKLSKYQGPQQLLNPSVFNMRKVRGCKLPSANGHSSAAALAAVLELVTPTGREKFQPAGGGDDATNTPTGREKLQPPVRSPSGAVVFSKDAVDTMRATATAAPVLGTGDSNTALLDNAGATFGLGFQVHEFKLADGSTCCSIGHSGLGGSVALALPEVGLSFAFTTNQLSMDSAARNEIISVICEEFGLEAPQTLIKS